MERIILPHGEGGSPVFGITLSSPDGAPPENCRVEKILPRVFSGLGMFLLARMSIKKIIGARKSAEGLRGESAAAVSASRHRLPL